MKIALVGYGRMGRIIERICVERGHQVVSRIDSDGSGDFESLDKASLREADGVIEFVLARGILDRIAIYADAGVPAVIGTTGWDDLVPEGKKLLELAAESKNKPGAVLRGNNFSVGAHLFFRLSAEAAKLVNSVDEYDVSMMEYHHNKKADYPSGTAITAAGGILAHLERKNHIVSNLPDGPLDPEALHVASLRVGSVPGVHEMRMDSQADFLTVRHEARSREGFALGAVRGLEWLQGRQGWYEAETFIDELLTGGK